MSESSTKAEFGAILSTVCDVFESQAILAPPGTPAPPRPLDRPRQRVDDEDPLSAVCDVVECAAVVPLPAAKAPPRPPGRERSVSESDANGKPEFPHRGATPTGSPAAV